MPRFFGSGLAELDATRDGLGRRDLNRVIAELARHERLSADYPLTLHPAGLGGRTLEADESVLGRVGFLVARLTGYALGHYSWVEQAVDAGTGSLIDRPGGRMGTTTADWAVEINGDSGCWDPTPGVKSFAMLVSATGQSSWRFYQVREGPAAEDPCPSHSSQVCVTAFSIRAYCSYVLGREQQIPPGADPGPDPDPFPGGLDATVAIDRVYLDGQNVTRYEPLDSGDTVSGTRCVTVAPRIDDPATAPTVEDEGGGTTGGTLLATGSYEVAYCWRDPWGSTRLSPASAGFQVGVAGPKSYPQAADPTVSPSGGGPTGGQLAVGSYTAVYSFSGTRGGVTEFSRATPRFQVGIPDPGNYPWADDNGDAYDPAVDGNSRGGDTALAPGTYYLKYAFAGPRGETAASPAIDCPVFPGAIPRLQGLPPLSLRPNASQIKIYLSDDGGTTYHAYGSTTAVAVDLVAPFDPGQPGPPSSNTTLGMIPRIILPGLGLRDHANGQVVYLQKDGAGGFRAYRAGITGTSADLDTPFDPLGATGGANTVPRGIPRVTYPTPPPLAEAVLYFKRLTDPDVPESWRYARTSTVSPDDLVTDGKSPVAAPTANLSGFGDLRVTITPSGGCPPLVALTNLSGQCQDRHLYAGFCCWQDTVVGLDDPKGGSAAGTATIGRTNPACGPTAATLTAPGSTTPVLNDCLAGTGSPFYLVACSKWDGTHTKDESVYDPGNPGTAFPTRGYTIKADGFFDICMSFWDDCDAATPLGQSESSVAYSHQNWVRNLTCGDCGSGPHPWDNLKRAAWAIPKQLSVAFSGPREMFGNYNGGTPITLDWDSTTDQGLDFLLSNQCSQGPPTGSTPSGALCGIRWRKTFVSGAQYACYGSGFCVQNCDVGGGPMGYAAPGSERDYASTTVEVIQWYNLDLGGGGHGPIAQVSWTNNLPSDPCGGVQGVTAMGLPLVGVTCRDCNDPSQPAVDGIWLNTGPYPASVHARVGRKDASNGSRLCGPVNYFTSCGPNAFFDCQYGFTFDVTVLEV